MKNSYKSFMKERLSSKQSSGKVYFSATHNRGTQKMTVDHFQLTESKGQNSRILKPSKVPYTNQIKGKIFGSKAEIQRTSNKKHATEINLTRQ